MAETQTKPMTLPEFLAWEERQEARYEYVDGAVVLMAGGTDAHDDTRGAIFAALRLRLLAAGSPCRVRLDLKLVCPNGRSRYPDVAVACGPRDPKSTRLNDPVVLVEVLSASTRATDYMVKPGDYGSVPSVAVYLIADPDEPRIDVLRREGDRLMPQEMPLEGAEAVLELPQLGLAISLGELYGLGERATAGEPPLPE